MNSRRSRDNEYKNPSTAFYPVVKIGGGGGLPLRSIFGGKCVDQSFDVLGIGLELGVLIGHDP